MALIIASISASVERRRAGRPRLEPLVGPQILRGHLLDPTFDLAIHARGIFLDRVAANFKAWLAQQAASGKAFTPEQQQWLEMIRDHIAASLGIEIDDFDLPPFSQQGGLGRVHQLFGAELPKVIEELNRELVA